MDAGSSSLLFTCFISRSDKNKQMKIMNFFVTPEKCLCMKFGTKGVKKGGGLHY